MASSTLAQSPTRPHPANAHPYSIKTTSTGILTRSNSSTAHGSWARHKYSPAPPSPNPDVHGSPSHRNASPTRSEMSVSASPSPSKYSRSWVGRTPAGERLKLPRHPYLWTPAHLATYLSTELNGSDGEPLDPNVVHHIVEFVQEQKIGGRAFLALDQEDFQEMDGVDQTWSDAFWDAACTLRATATPYRPSRISSAAYKRGRVRGIVGVFERSASESSDVGEDDLPPHTRLRGSSVSGSGYESTGDEAAPAQDDGSPAKNIPPSAQHASSTRGSAAPTPRPSHTPVPTPASPDADRDRTPHTREVEIVSLTDAEPSMAELYEKTDGIPPPSPTHRHSAMSDGEDDLGETVKITVPEDDGDINTLAENAGLVPSPAPVSAPPSLEQLFAPVPEAHVIISSPVVTDPPPPQSVYILPSGNSEVALRALDALRARLEIVEHRLATMEHKDTTNGDAAPSLHDPEDETMNIDDAPVRWNDTRQSAYVLLAGAAAGASVVLVPLLFRHIWTR